MTENINNNYPVILTLDAGGTNFVFGAMQDNEFITDNIILPSKSNDLDSCINQLITGFEQTVLKLKQEPVAISFAFPGPADYEKGIIGGYLPNFPSFRNGVALGKILENRFKIPVFINNDGDLFAYGEALAGRLPEINNRIREMGGEKEYKSLTGYTFGTGFGIGIVYDKVLHLGNNCCVETFCIKHKDNPDIIVEEGVSVRAVKRVYRELSHSEEELEPKEIYEIAEGLRKGDRECAIKSFEKFGEIAGDAMATAATLLDGIIVIGGGLTAAKKYIMPSLLKEMRSKIKTLSGETLNRVQMQVYDLDNDVEFRKFVDGDKKMINVYGTEEYVLFDRSKSIGICVSELGASKAISVGAYNYALNKLKNI